MNLQILCAGHSLRPEEQRWIDDYHQRLKPYAHLSIVRVKESNGSTPQARAAATWEDLRKKTAKNAYTVLLDAQGKEMTTEDFSRLVFDRFERSGKKCLTFVIGGSYGIPPEAKNQVDHVISLSLLTLPHRIALLILVEQLYRVLSWRAGAPYHHP